MSLSSVIYQCRAHGKPFSEIDRALTPGKSPELNEEMSADYIPQNVRQVIWEQTQPFSLVATRISGHRYVSFGMTFVSADILYGYLLQLLQSSVLPRQAAMHLEFLNQMFEKTPSHRLRLVVTRVVDMLEHSFCSANLANLLDKMAISSDRDSEIMLLNNESIRLYRPWDISQSPVFAFYNAIQELCRMISEESSLSRAAKKLRSETAVMKNELRSKGISFRFRSYGKHKKWDPLIPESKEKAMTSIFELCDKLLLKSGSAHFAFVSAIVKAATEVCENSRKTRKNREKEIRKEMVSLEKQKKHTALHVQQKRVLFSEFHLLLQVKENWMLPVLLNKYYDGIASLLNSSMLDVFIRSKVIPPAEFVPILIEAREDIEQRRGEVSTGVRVLQDFLSLQRTIEIYAFRHKIGMVRLNGSKEYYDHLQERLATAQTQGGSPMEVMTADPDSMEHVDFGEAEENEEGGQ